MFNKLYFKESGLHKISSTASKKVKTLFLTSTLLVAAFSLKKDLNTGSNIFADEVLSETLVASEDAPALIIPDSVKNSLKQKGIYKNKIVISWQAISDVNTYLVTFGDITTYIDNSNNKTTLTATFKCKAGNLITDDITIYPITTDDIISFIPDESSPSITLSASSLMLLPKAPSKVTVSEAFPSLKEVRMSIDRPSYTSGVQFKVYSANGKVMKNKTLKFKKKTSLYASSLISKIDNTRFYKVKMRSYCIFNKKKKYGKWETKYITNQVNLTSESLGNENAILLKWNKIKGAKNYTIYGSTKSTKGFKEICTCKGSSKKITKVSGKKLTSGKQYYFYVVAHKKSGKYTFDSPIRYSANITYIK